MAPNYYSRYGNISSQLDILGTNIARYGDDHMFEAYFYSANSNSRPRVEGLQCSAVPLPAAGIAGGLLLGLFGVVRTIRWGLRDISRQTCNWKHEWLVYSTALAECWLMLDCSANPHLYP